MTNKIWKEDTKYSIEVENPIMLSIKEFNDINRIYQFVYLPKYKVYFDKKWHKTVAQKLADLPIVDDFHILFSKNWIQKEVFRSQSKTLLDICENNILCKDIYDKFMYKMNTEKLLLKNIINLEEGIEEIEDAANEINSE